MPYIGESFDVQKFCDFKLGRAKSNTKHALDILRGTCLQFASACTHPSVYRTECVNYHFPTAL